ncbi:group II intron maturase-specific domain-containing protein [Nostoc sp.]|uniref:group II intron maturase-specific domain-containing protein n=1 Tax=Nostoc sp. TaxID=1180 RepID=UPI002FF94BAD
MLGVEKRTNFPFFLTFPVGKACIIRYADDFVILHEDLTVVQRCQQIIAEWLSNMGLELKPSKTRLTHTFNRYGDNEPGFNFLGFNIRQFSANKHTTGKNTNGTLLGFTTIISPSQEKQTVHYKQVVSTINAHKTASQVKLIGKLNPIIRGWANYYSCVVSKDTYYHQDYLMYQKLRAWAKRRHPNKSGEWVSNKYWHTNGGDNWVFSTIQEKNPLRLFKHGETLIVRHEKVKGDASPYDGNLIYWSKRIGTHPEMPTRVATLLKK